VSGETDVVKALREGTAKPEFLEFGVVVEGLVINVPSPYLVVPPTANMYLQDPICAPFLRVNGQSSGRREAGCALPLNRKDVETNVEAC